ncbi:hypothetical protein QBC33DRAFT_520348 [Phialemonium atrogriseum]|uniref:Secreted protein n=1 Tax=Phialemonium atrogriseum TaxID=1093897 RepID=A0AAJ0CAW3_9PEZI|nr:uncharacterized protein QBC33DRAFT_520348 [Phialemonium atrogriseum]KAK1772128.1 hypothetical protein QBC33DRAFT_520348 [Phialemonium atrogriseum]
MARHGECFLVKLFACWASYVACATSSGLACDRHLPVMHMTSVTTMAIQIPMCFLVRRCCCSRLNRPNLC